MESPEAAAARYSSGSDDCRHATFAKRKRTKRLRALSAGTTTEEEEDTAHCLILLAMGPAREYEEDEVEDRVGSRKLVATADAGAGARAGFYVYECRSCSKCFSSFQALGGHRASHRKPKPTAYRAVTDTVPDTEQPAAEAGRPRVHECGICGAEFASGQALGGHMRRHRPVGPAAEKNKIATKNVLALDLNLPAPAEESGMAYSLALVGCHY